MTADELRHDLLVRLPSADVKKLRRILKLVIDDYSHKAWVVEQGGLTEGESKDWLIKMRSMLGGKYT